jgi:hypothetical protein
MLFLFGVSLKQVTPIPSKYTLAYNHTMNAIYSQTEIPRLAHNTKMFVKTQINSPIFDVLLVGSGLGVQALTQKVIYIQNLTLNETCKVNLQANMNKDLGGAISVQFTVN